MKATSEELAIFVSVVESGSFSRAAEQSGTIRASKLSGKPGSEKAGDETWR